MAEPGSPKVWARGLKHAMGSHCKTPWRLNTFHYLIAPTGPCQGLDLRDCCIPPDRSQVDPSALVAYKAQPPRWQEASRAFLEGHRPPSPPGTQHDMPPQDTDAPDSVWGSTSMQRGTTWLTPKPVPRDLQATRSVADPTNATLSARRCASPHGPRRGPPTRRNSVQTPTSALSGDRELVLGAKGVLPTLEMEEHPPDT